MVNDLNFVTPESEGIPSEAILDFIDFFEELRVNVQSFIIVRHGNIVAEGYYKPFDKDSVKRIYSCTKSVVSYAVGKLYGEGLVDLNAPLVSYFPEIKNPHPEMAKVTVEDALKMCVPQSKCPYVLDKAVGDTITVDGGWTANYFSGKNVIDKPHGRMFRYSSQSSYILGDMVKRITGKDFLDYLRPELDAIGVAKDIRCVRCPDGVQWASSGMIITTRDFAKLGELLLTHGEYKGKQLLPRDYMERAVSKLVDTNHVGSITPGKFGYGYQMWQEPYGFGMHGMRGQVVHCFPDKELMVVITSNESDYADKLYYAASRVYKKISDAPLAENKEAFGRLSEKLSSLKINRSYGAAHSALEEKINGVTYRLGDNKMGITDFRLEFGEREGCFIFNMKGEEKKLPFGYGEYVDTTFPDKTFYDLTMNREGGRELSTISTGSWGMPDRLLIVADIIDNTPGTLGIALEFYGDEVALQMTSIGEAILSEYDGNTSGRAAN